MAINQNEITKLKTPYRVIASIVCQASFLAFIITIFHVIRDFNWGGILTLILFGVIIHLTFISANTGYPPKYLYWTSSKKEEI